MTITKITFFVLVNGAWSAWGTWGNCSEVCGPGIKERTRVCNDPPPQFEGADCPVDEPNTETETCNEKPCRKLIYIQNAVLYV